MSKLPVAHTELEDCLPKDHPLAHDDVYCKGCGVMVHAFNNECMQGWMETVEGNFCFTCIALDTIIGPQSK